MSGHASAVLSDATILELVEQGRIRLDPWDRRLVQPASVDLRLGDSFRVFHNYRASAIDLRQPPENLTEEVVIPAEEPFVIHPGEFCLGRTLEWVELPDDVVARIEGKALAIDTPVPTPAGWATMGELEPGDWVFDVEGNPTPVIATSETVVGRPCRALDFSDGTTIVADVDHQWQVWTAEDRARRGPPRLVRTAEIERTLKCGTEYNHRVAAAPAPHLRPGRPIDPGALEASLVTGATATITSTDAPPRQLVLPRKPAQEKASPRSRAGRAITAVRACDSVPVMCIEVGSPDGVFVVGRSFIPTHNSSLGRLGLIVHATAGFCDPGWRGTLTLELNNLTRVPIKLYPGLLIAQLSFMALDRPALRPYGSPELGSHYQGQRAATESRYEGARTKEESPRRHGTPGPTKIG